MKIFMVVVLLLFFIFQASPAEATYDPVSRTNNIVGIHILFPAELEKAAKLVNSSGGDWGYITIPIQYGDRNIVKWQEFMNDAQKYHLIPIIRISTEPYFKNTGVWRKPTDFDIVDFANFLNSLEWPTKNRYILLFNEVNRFDEWGGDAPSPSEYADFVSYAVDSFKNRNSDFFVIAGGLDNASPNDGIKYLDNLTFLEEMGQYDANVFKKIDGFSSHSYPNPDFAEPPSKSKLEGTSTYKYEVALVEKYAEKNMPVFITETGWNAEKLPGSVIASYFKTALLDIWGQDARIVAVTPFILESNGGPFDKFTFYKGDNLTVYGTAYKDIPKKKGDPIRNVINIKPSILEVVTRKNQFQVIPIPGVLFSSDVLRSYIKAILAFDK